MNNRDKETGRFVINRNNFGVKEREQIIYVYDHIGKLLFFTDLNLAETVRCYNWCKSADGYAATRIDNQQVPAHRFLIGAKQGDIIDHKNRNKKDNRLCNLRKCTKSENALNSKIREDNTSGHTGVWYRKDTKKWVAEIKLNYKKISLGCYDIKKDAVSARKQFENYCLKGGPCVN